MDQVFAVWYKLKKTKLFPYRLDFFNFGRICKLFLVLYLADLATGKLKPGINKIDF